MMRQRTDAPSPDRWTRRRLAGFTVRVLIVVVPFVAAIGTIALLGQVVPASGRFAGGARYVLVFGISWLMMAVAHRVLHRLIPLAALLEMSLLFPEHAPSRLKLARRAASRRDLDDLLSGSTARQDESTQEAAERILALVSALSEHDRGTRGHSERVRGLTDLIAERMGLSQHDRDRLRWAALLHDIGKLYIPVEVLNKPAKPSPREWELLRRHPAHGERIAAPLLGWLGEWGDVIVQHHEKFDGTGYPTGLAGHRICLGARIVAVADAYDVMTAARAYKKPTGRANALRELVACSGKHFDPDIVRALITLPQRRLLLTMGPISWLTGLPFVGQAPTAVSATLTSQASVAVGAVALTGTAALTPLAGTTRPVSDHDTDRPAITVSSPAASRSGSGRTAPKATLRAHVPSSGTPSGPPSDEASEPSPDKVVAGATAAGTPGTVPLENPAGTTRAAPTPMSTAPTVGTTSAASGPTTRPAPPPTPLPTQSKPTTTSTSKPQTQKRTRPRIQKRTQKRTQTRTGTKSPESKATPPVPTQHPTAITGRRTIPLPPKKRQTASEGSRNTGPKPTKHSTHSTASAPSEGPSDAGQGSSAVDSNSGEHQGNQGDTAEQPSTEVP